MYMWERCKLPSGVRGAETGIQENLKLVQPETSKVITEMAYWQAKLYQGLDGDKRGFWQCIARGVFKCEG